jgi:hypothetical protein
MVPALAPVSSTIRPVIALVSPVTAWDYGHAPSVDRLVRRRLGFVAVDATAVTSIVGGLALLSPNVRDVDRKCWGRSD